MDTVRFGRALGMGARGAAKAVLEAADAAAAPNPAIKPSPQTSRLGVSGRVEHLRTTKSGLALGGRRFGETAWRPFVRLGGVLWLEMTGVFFGLFVLFAGVNAWKLRANLRETAANHMEHQHLVWSFAMAALFGYFCISSFLRAGRRGRVP